jgi:hypothetical protein
MNIHSNFKDHVCRFVVLAGIIFLAMPAMANPSGGTRFPCSVAYIRFDWANVESQEGQYNWKFIDDVISAWKPREAGVAMRVMTANAHSGGYYSSPKWLFDAGCKGFEYNAGCSGLIRLTKLTKWEIGATLL